MSYDLVTKFISNEHLGKSWEVLYSEIHTETYIDFLANPIIWLFVIPIIIIIYLVLAPIISKLIPQEDNKRSKRATTIVIIVVSSIVIDLFLFVLFTILQIPNDTLEQYTQIRYFEETQLTDVIKDENYHILDPYIVNSKFFTLNGGSLKTDISLVDKDITLNQANVLIVESSKLPHLALIKVDPLIIDGKEDKTIKTSQKIDYILNIAQSE